MRGIETYRDACQKLARNPDAKIPGWRIDDVSYSVMR
jgi:hypothetical protein